MFQLKYVRLLRYDIWTVVCEFYIGEPILSCFLKIISYSEVLLISPHKLQLKFQLISIMFIAFDKRFLIFVKKRIFLFTTNTNVMLDM